MASRKSSAKSVSSFHAFSGFALLCLAFNVGNTISGEPESESMLLSLRSLDTTETERFFARDLLEDYAKLHDLEVNQCKLKIAESIRNRITRECLFSKALSGEFRPVSGFGKSPTIHWDEDFLVVEGSEHNCASVNQLLKTYRSFGLEHEFEFDALVVEVDDNMRASITTILGKESRNEAAFSAAVGDQLNSIADALAAEGPIKVLDCPKQSIGMLESGSALLGSYVYRPYSLMPGKDLFARLTEGRRYNVKFVPMSDSLNWVAAVNYENSTVSKSNGLVDGEPPNQSVRIVDTAMLLNKDAVGILMVEHPHQEDRHDMFFLSYREVEDDISAQRQSPVQEFRDRLATQLEK